ncbi:MAG: cation transporter [Gammaproteobacteria bacterium]|nr:cation diffusion facilitator family transporter [Gammaproteobacteria bacterium]MYF29290.1 cation transporter [Gammaproteobacteria bacterium]MYK46870.1 cation transporter [Gammaproteobacteria bacterium]
MLARAFALIAGFMLIEVVGAWISNSLTLAADAGHMFLDASALGLAWFALRLSRRSPDDRLTYGYHRFQVLAAFVNALALFGLCAWILIEAAGRLRAPEAIAPLPVLGVAVVGLLVNLVAYRMLHRSDNLNVQSAALHVLGDLLGSVAAIVSALAVLWFGWRYADPILALLVVAILVRGAWRVLRDAARILLEAAPQGIDINAVRSALAQVAGVLEIHHLHVWALTGDKPVLTLHARVAEDADEQSTVSSVKAVLRTTFGIDHSTVQVERGACPDEAQTANPIAPMLDQ